MTETLTLSPEHLEMLKSIKLDHIRGRYQKSPEKGITPLEIKMIISAYQLIQSLTEGRNELSAEDSQLFLEFIIWLKSATQHATIPLSEVSMYLPLYYKLTNQLLKLHYNGQVEELEAHYKPNPKTVEKRQIRPIF